MWLDRQGLVHPIIGLSLAAVFVLGSTFGNGTQVSARQEGLETFTPVEANSDRSTWKRLIGPIEVGPIGWLRTSGGWEPAEHWEVSSPPSSAVQINRVIQGQKFQEHGTTLSWCIAMVLSFVRRIDPVTLIATEICLLSFFVALVLHRRESRSRASLVIEMSN